MPFEIPREITPVMMEILGRPNFTCGGLAQLARSAGHEIPRKAEAEQAFVIHQLLLCWIDAGDDGWADKAEELFNGWHAKAFPKEALPS